MYSFHYGCNLLHQIHWCSVKPGYIPHNIRLTIHKSRNPHLQSSDMLLVHVHLFHTQTHEHMPRMGCPVERMADQGGSDNVHWYTDARHSRNSARFPVQVSPRTHLYHSFLHKIFPAGHKCSHRNGISSFHSEILFCPIFPCRVRELPCRQKPVHNRNGMAWYSHAAC